MKEIWKNYRRFFKDYGNSVTYVCIAVFMAVLQAISIATIPYLNKILIDDGILAKNISIIYQIGFLLIGIFVFSLVMGWLQKLLFQGEQKRLVIRVKCDLMRSILNRKPFSNSMNNGYLLSRIENDPQGIVSLFIDRPIQLVLQVLTIFVFLTIMFHMSMVFASLSLGIMIIIGIVAIFTTKYILLFAEKIKELNAQKYGLASNIIAGYSQIKLCNSEDREEQNYAGTLDKIYKTEMKNLRFRTTIDSAVSLITGLPLHLLLLIGGLYVVREKISLGSLVAISLYFSRLISLSSQVFSTNFNIQPALASLKRIYEIIDITKEPPLNDTSKVGKISLKKEIEFQNISASYGNNKILHNISFKIPHGQITAIVGTSGAGKTTIVKLLLMLMKPTSGNIFWDKQSYSQIHPNIIRYSVGLVPQDAYLFNRTIGENILYRLENISDKERKRALTLLEKFHLSSLLVPSDDKGALFNKQIEELAGNISAGEKQRLAIIRELLYSPEVLIWDEATANIDSMSEKAISKELMLLLPEKTIIIIAHRLSTVQLAQNIIVLKDGEIIGQGPQAEIVDKCSHFTKIFAEQLSLQTG